MRVVSVLSNLWLATVVAKYPAANMLRLKTVSTAVFEALTNPERLPFDVTIRQIVLVLDSA